MASIQKHSAIQGTMTTQYRSPRSPRKMDNAKENVKCLECWSSQPTHHPSLFCSNCLKTLQTMMSSNGERDVAVTHFNDLHKTPLSNSDSFDSQDSDLTAFEKHGHTASNQKLQMLRTPRTRELIINSSLGLYSEQQSDRAQLSSARKENVVRASGGQRKRNTTRFDQKRQEILAEKNQEYEKTATKCGFCGPEERRRRLLTYCIHCRKHMCASHGRFHSATRVFRPHAIVDLVQGANKALM